MKNILMALAFILAAAGIAQATPRGVYLTLTNEPVSVSDESLASMKHATGSTYSFLGVVAVGDASIQTLAKSAGITHVKYIDKQCIDLCRNYYLYAEEKFTIYGD